MEALIVAGFMAGCGIGLALSLGCLGGLLCENEDVRRAMQTSVTQKSLSHPTRRFHSFQKSFHRR